jgi:beta-mannanase
MLLRWAWEFNGDWFAEWDGSHNGRDPAGYARAFRRIHRIFREQGADNVAFVWSPNWNSSPDVAWNRMERYYPGDAYVDWTCADGYNWGTSQTVATSGWTSRWQTFDELFADAYRRATALAPTKPFMLGEFASAEAGGDKAAWIRDAAARMEAAYPQLRAAVWFNYNKETDWRVESSPASLAAFRASFVSNPHFVWR